MDGENKTLTRKIEIKNELGLHARPSSMLINIANKFQSDIFIEKNSERVNGKSIMGVMMLAASKGSVLAFTAIGTDAEQALNAIEEVIESKFGEE